MKIQKAPTYDLLVIDGKHLAYRAYYAYISLKTTTGHFSGLVYGFLSLLSQYKKNYGNLKHKAVVVWEGNNTVRKAILPSYKGNRDKSPKQGFNEQMIDLREFLQYIGIGQYTAEGYEGDDVIYYLAAMYSERLKDILIISGDKDVRQQVRERSSKRGAIHVLYPKNAHKKTDDILTVEEVNKMHHISHPSQLTFLLALCGDKTDNIPRVDSFTEKKGLQFLEEVYTQLNATPTFKDLVKELKKQNFKNTEAVIKEFTQNYQLTNLAQLWEKDTEGKMVDRRPTIVSALKAQEILHKYQISKVKVEHFLNNS